MKKIKRNILLIAIVALTLIVVPVFAQTSIQSDQVNYNLPYPGILPDNPLYGLKAFRDRVIEFFISDPTKKAEFDLLQADKRLSVSIALFDKGKKDLSENTVSKGENYFEDAIKNVKISQKEGTEIDPSLLSNLELSSKKHKEILEGFVQRTDNGLKNKFSKDLQRANQFISEVHNFNPN